MIIAVLRQAEASVTVADLVRKYVSKRRFTTLKAKYGGLDVSQLRRLKGALKAKMLG
jgi:putative transposase